MRVVVNMDVCESNGLCAGLAPAVFELGDDDVLRVAQADVPAEHLDAVRAAVRSCPKQALSLAD
jgi:ferredoxin